MRADKSHKPVTANQATTSQNPVATTNEQLFANPRIVFFAPILLGICALPVVAFYGTGLATDIILAPWVWVGALVWFSGPIALLAKAYNMRLSPRFANRTTIVRGAGLIAGGMNGSVLAIILSSLLVGAAGYSGNENISLSVVFLVWPLSLLVGAILTIVGAVLYFQR
ncbi:hypothetical protein CSA80_03040 [Candidatus Saccharibacteria bacterium]|nr:MAG: hypothetical protein CR973_00195 [Candidatus Saccharibacteria bacterium]PID99065.1 MAG: hypothetical protein CSA80_03040 [Candidatus Saccharibacteria bacterium]